MKKVIVIGAGISGLSAAIYLARSGFDVTICEQHNMAGGMCTSWKRKGYLFEGAVHWLTGSSPQIALNRLWKETGALNDKVPILMQERFSTIEWEEKTISIYRDINKTAQCFLAISPNDKKVINELVKDVKRFSCIQMPIMDIKGVKSEKPIRMKGGEIIKMLPALPKLTKLMKISCKDYVKRFKHPGIQKALCFLPDGYNTVSLIATLSTLDSGDGGYPEGGSLAMIERMVKTFIELDGKLLLKTPVKKVKIDSTNDCTTGVILENGTALDADVVIVTQETIAAIERLFETPLQDQWLTELRNNIKPAVCTFIGIGIRAELPEPTIPTWKLDEPIKYAQREITDIGFNNYAKYKGYAPEGCSCLTTIFPGDTYDYWKKAKDEGRYEDEKKVLAEQIKRAIYRKYPQADGNIDVIDIATPLTYERYTGAYHGSWMSITGIGEKMKIYPGFIKNISGLYFAGHRLMPPGGLPVAINTGRTAAQMVCRQFGVLFKS